LVKIAFLVRSLDCGGAERQLFVLGKGLKQRGHDVSVTVFYPNGFYERPLREAGVRVHSVGRQGRWDFIRPLRRALRCLENEQPEMVHSYMNLANIVTGLFKRRLRPAKIVWGVRNSGIREYGWLTILGAKLESALAPAADLIICNSSAGVTAGPLAGCRADRLTSIPNGFDPLEFFIDPVAREQTRADLGVGRDEFLIGRVGRLDPVKDYPGFLQMAKLLLKENGSRFRFVCVGPGPAEYARRLKQISAELGLGDRVIWTGLIKEMRNIYNALDLFVSTSKANEGFPNVLLEAMACGIPCVSTDVGDSREVLGDFGIIAPPQDYTALANACRALAGDRPSASSVRASALERFNVDVLVRRTETTLSRLIGRPSAHSGPTGPLSLEAESLRDR
jgi:glycosyltransferase involved in cell wall biosynthesis